MPAAGPSVRISRAVRRRPPGPVLWVRGAPPRSVSAPAGPPPVWRGAVRPVLCSPADSARCRTASAVLSFRPWRDSRIPGAAFDLCPSARSGRARSAGLLSLRRAGFLRPPRRCGSTVCSRLGCRPVSRAAARLCSSIRPAGRLSAAGFPGAVGQLHAGQGAPALGRALLLGRTPLAWRRAAQGGGPDLPSGPRALCPGPRSALRVESALSQGSSRLPRSSGRSLWGAARPLAGRLSPDRECSGRLSLRRQHAAVCSALGTLLPECQLCAGRRNIQLPAGRLPTA